jgi:diguanylate cyclase
MFIGRNKSGDSNTAQKTPSDIGQETKFANQAIALMQKSGIAPNPENYALWYHYVAAQNKELIHEIDTIVKNSLEFTRDTSLYLYNKYIVADATQKAFEDSSLTAQKVLMDVLKVVNEFADETKSYNKDVDTYLEKVSQDFGESSVKDILKQIIEATVTLKQSSSTMTRKLEESKEEINDLKRNLQQVTNESQRDFLTGVFNRKTFERLVDDQIKQAQEKKTALCLLMIDIDHFKKFNDRFGHLLGDEVLKTVARTLMDILKGRDVVARFGGEEFIVTLPETPVEGAMKVAEMVRTSIASKQLKRKNTGETYGTITVSVGVALFRPETDTLPMLIKRADDALYQSKHNGRNKVTCEQA